MTFAHISYQFAFNPNHCCLFYLQFVRTNFAWEQGTPKEMKNIPPTGQPITQDGQVRRIHILSLHPLVLKYELCFLHGSLIGLSRSDCWCTLLDITSLTGLLSFFFNVPSWFSWEYILLNRLHLEPVTGSAAAEPN